MRVKASAVAPANPASTRPSANLRTLRALPFTIVAPWVTWPSPAITVVPPLRTARMVVPCQAGKVLSVIGAHVAALTRRVKANELHRRRGRALRPPPGAARDRWAGPAGAEGSA